VLDPLSVRAHRLLGWGLYLQRRTSDAEKWLQAALVLDCEPLETRYLLAHVCLSEGRLAEALEHARLCQTASPDPLGLGVLGACLARLNHRQEALEIVAKLSDMAKSGYVDPRAIQEVQIALNDTEGVIESVQRLLDERSPWALFLKLDPELDPVRSNPRFAALVARLGM
jgi:tetratricopeptide (TPR) repeat protein